MVRVTFPTQMNDRQLNRLIAGVVAAIVLIVVAVGAIYVSDRWVDRGPTMADRHIADLEAQVQANPDAITARLALVGAYVAANRNTDALSQLDQVIQASPDNKTALLARGDLLRQTGNVAGAIKDYTAIVDIMKGAEFAGQDTELASAYYDLGMIAIEQNRPADAINFLGEALKISPTDADVLYQLGTAYLQSGSAAKAADALRNAVTFVPTGWCDPYVTLAQAYRGASNAPEAEWAGAMADFCQSRPAVAKGRLTALLGGAAATDALVGLAMIAESENDRAAAADFYTRALARDPQNFLAQSGLSRVATGTPAPVSSPSGSITDGRA
ncbi:MAG TPA: tetratricopeptide repeat protein [Candidatus Limnocylindrales bacterium]